MSTHRYASSRGKAPTRGIVTRALLLVPAEMVEPMGSALREALGARVSHALAPRSSSSSPTNDLVDLLEQEGWQTERYPDGRVRISGRSAPLQDIERDPVLESALGRVAAGCFVQLYSAGNRQWEIRFYGTRRELVEGFAAFPQDPEWGRVFRSMLVLREALPRDLEQLAALSPVPVRLEEGPVLIAERGDKFVAFVQYNTLQEGVCTITRLVALAQGDLNGYPQALVDELCRQYRHIIVSRLVSSDRYRLWKRLGFAWTEEMPVGKRRGKPGYYAWRRPEEAEIPRR